MIIRMVNEMKKIIKNSGILLMFFIVFLFKESIYGLFIKTNNLDEVNKSIENIKETYYEKEYKDLLKTTNLLEWNSYESIYSKVLYRDIYEFYNEITILRGSENNIKKNSAVINENGLIGTIKKVNKNSSVVSLITNTDSKISIRVNNSYGILKFSKNNLIITSINNYENIGIGNVVYTSGLGNLPANIKIGEVENIITDDLGIEQQVIVKPYVDFDNINYVAIINGDAS